MNVVEFIKHISFITEAHGPLYSKTPEKSVRLWDKKTPYSIHPLWCAMTILTETALPYKIRRDGYTALLYHDILEDTTKKLPRGINKTIRNLIKDMTFHGGIDEEMKKIWSKSIEIRLLKLYDKTSNLLDASWMNPKERRKYILYTKRLMKDVEKNYGTLNIISIARAVCKMI